ncbi:hypothetical protein EJ571_10870 [Mycobacteroides franklinii]|uniref:Uncharacterized protein n=1 Tax=Mycobacteroides franklinii TaxID=948102 RepID=A0A4R5PCB9_9MYCO|nr:hypothetical protein BST24_05035 [Mycobacteroides franklinii]TDH22415.1 hypothetical protein EJ571_10870 [Mycobacteroides franklinii]
MYVVHSSDQLGRIFPRLLGCGNECMGGLADLGCGSRPGVRTASRTVCLACVSHRDTDVSNVR